MDSGAGRIDFDFQDVARPQDIEVDLRAIVEEERRTAEPPSLTWEQQRAAEEAAEMRGKEAMMEAQKKLQTYWAFRDEFGRNVILFVDDNPTLRELAMRQFSEEYPDCEIVFAQSGSEALGILKEREGLAERVALIITDLEMEDGDGIEFIQGLHGINGYGGVVSDDIRGQLARVPRLMHTTFNDAFTQGTNVQGEIQRLIDAGRLNGIVSKNEGPLALRNAVVATIKELMFKSN